jgi:hypothetical protein
MPKWRYVLEEARKLGSLEGYYAIFPKATTLMCVYHIRKNVRSKCKTYYKVKDLKVKNGKEIKSKDVVKAIMDAWKNIVK